MEIKARITHRQDGYCFELFTDGLYVWDAADIERISYVDFIRAVKEMLPQDSWSKERWNEAVRRIK